MSKRKSYIPSKEMRIHYAEQLCLRLQEACPDVNKSQYCNGFSCRPQWKHDSPDPVRIRVGVRHIDGSVTVFHEPLYGFPSPELVAKIGLLL